MYDPKLWIEIKERYWKNESPEDISSSLGGKPSSSAIWKKVKAENWDEKKYRKVQRFDEKSGVNYDDYLENQLARYHRILTHFDNTMTNENTFGNPAPFCKPTEVIATHKDFREVRAIKIQEGKPKADLEKQIIKQQEAIKHPELKRLYDQAEQLQEQIEAVSKELGL